MGTTAAAIAKHWPGQCWLFASSQKASYSLRGRNQSFCDADLSELTMISKEVRGVHGIEINGAATKFISEQWPMKPEVRRGPWTHLRPHLQRSIEWHHLTTRSIFPDIAFIDGVSVTMYRSRATNFLSSREPCHHTCLSQGVARD